MYPDVLGILNTKLADKPLLTEIASNLSVYIKKILVDYLPEEDDYKETMVHVEHTIGDQAETWFLRAQLGDGAKRLTYLHPTYCQQYKKNVKFMDPEEQNNITRSIQHTMLINILTQSEHRANRDVWDSQPAGDD